MYSVTDSEIDEAILSVLEPRFHKVVWILSRTEELLRGNFRKAKKLSISSYGGFKS
jgi:hypothetical protein